MKKSIKVIADSLKFGGCYSLDNFLSLEEITPILKKVRELLASVELRTTKEYDNFIVANNFSSTQFKGSPKDSHKPVIITRGVNGFDQGFIEIFKAHHLIPEIPVEKITNFIINVFREMNITPRLPIEFSIYSNDSGTAKVRGYHRDIPLGGNKFMNKMFVYLTDVPDISYGPHSYIPGTHLPNKCLEFAHQLVGDYEDPNEYDWKLEPKIFLGKAGTMILTNQAGFHKGFQHSLGKERIVLVCKIRK